MTIPADTLYARLKTHDAEALAIIELLRQGVSVDISAFDKAKGYCKQVALSAVSEEFLVALDDALKAERNRMIDQAKDAAKAEADKLQQLFADIEAARLAPIAAPAPPDPRPEVAQTRLPRHPAYHPFAG